MLQKDDSPSSQTRMLKPDEASGRKGRSSRMANLLIAAGALLVGGAVGLCFWLFSSKGEPLAEPSGEEQVPAVEVPAPAVEVSVPQSQAQAGQPEVAEQPKAAEAPEALGPRQGKQVWRQGLNRLKGLEGTGQVPFTITLNYDPQSGRISSARLMQGSSVIPLETGALSTDGTVLTLKGGSAQGRVRLTVQGSPGSQTFTGTLSRSDMESPVTLRLE